MAGGIRLKDIELSPAAEAAVARGDLNREQAAAVFAPLGPVLTLGPPGTGKTHALVHRVVANLDAGIAPERFFLTSFTDASAAEIVARVNRHCGRRFVAPRGARLQVGTLHALARRVLARFAREIGLPDRLSLIRGPQAADLVERLRIPIPPARGAPTEDEALELAGAEPALGDGWHGAGLAGYDDLALAFGATVADATRRVNPLEALIGGAVPARLHLGDVRGRKALEVFRGWQERLIWPEEACRIAAGEEVGGVRYVGDPVYLGLAEGYKRYKDALREMRTEDGQAVIDFSDMLTLPVFILQSNEKVRARVQGAFHCVIAEEYQDNNIAMQVLLDLVAGGCRNLSAFGDVDQLIYGFNGADPAGILRFGERYPDSVIIALRQNYRSRPPIVDVANRLIRWNRERYETFLVPARSDAPIPEAVSRALATPVVAGGEPGEARVERVEVVEYPSDVVEAEDIARKIAALLSAGEAAEQIAVLTRSGTRTSWIALRLRAHGIRIRLVGEGFRTARESRIVEGLIKAAWLGVSGPAHPRGPELVGLLGSGPAASELFAAAKQIRDRGLAFPERWAELCAAAGDAAVAALPSGLKRHAVTLWEERARAAAEAATEIGGFEPWHAAAAIEGREEAAVTVGPISTVMGSIHGAKGLEYDHVFLPCCEADLCPAAEDTASEEERRLFYVALSRARETCTVSWAVNRIALREGRRSPYVDECMRGTPGVAFVEVRPALPFGPCNQPGPRPGAAVGGRAGSGFVPPLSAPDENSAYVPSAQRLRHELSLGLATTPDGTVWEAALVDAGGASIARLFINPDGDYVAYLAAAEHGVPPEDLARADSAAAAAGKIGEYVISLFAGAEVAVYTDDHQWGQTEFAIELARVIGAGQPGGVQLLSVRWPGDGRPAGGRAVEIAKSVSRLTNA